MFQDPEFQNLFVSSVCGPRVARIGLLVGAVVSVAHSGSEAGRDEPPGNLHTTVLRPRKYARVFGRILYSG